MTRLEVHQEEDDGDEEESDESGGFDGSLMSSKLVDAEEGWGPPGENQQYRQQRRWRQQFPPIFAIVAAALRKSLVTCSVEPREDVCASMDIGWPTNVRHIAHVTFDRFQGFLGLPVELEHDVLRTAPSARFGSVQNATGLCLSQQLKIADFSYNFLVGEVPPCLQYLPRTSFQGNCLQDKGSILQRATQQCGGTHLVKEHGAANATRRAAKGGFKHQKPQQPTWLLILEIFTGVVVVVFIITAVYTALSKLKPKSWVVMPRKRSINSRDSIVMFIDGEMLKHVLRLSRQELEIACEDFSNIIGSSSDSVVYKGTMKGGSEIAVISLSISEDHWTNHHEVYFENEVADLSRLSHDNTAKLLGYCMENVPFTRMLIFEYASNGTLYEHLHYGEGCQLTWTRRMKIAIGIARGLRYLHNELQPSFTLSELNSSSVYLTEDFSPKLVDFENWNLMFSRSERNSGYINGGAFHCFPDSLDRRHTNVQGNIFAFGVILLEIISGRPPYCKERGSLVDWALGFIDRPDTMCHLVDPELRYFKHDDLRIVCSVVSLCVQSEPSKRPSMQTLCGMLENGIDTSASADLKESPLAWAELALSS